MIPLGRQIASGAAFATLMGILMVAMGFSASAPQPMPLWVYKAFGVAGFFLIIGSVAAWIGRGEALRHVAIVTRGLAAAAMTIVLVYAAICSLPMPNKIMFCLMFGFGIYQCGESARFYRSDEAREYFADRR